MAVRRRKSTSRKSIRLTDDGRSQIQAWADEQGVSFSAAIESLSLLGMGEPAVVAFAPLMVSAVRFEIQRQRILQNNIPEIPKKVESPLIGSYILTITQITGNKNLIGQSEDHQ